jgi:uncharacterized protein YegP (UPF0339 family)
MKNPKFTVFKDKKGQFRFNLRAANGKIIFQSEGYTTKDKCKKGIRSIKKVAPIAPVEDIA